MNIITIRNRQYPVTILPVGELTMANLAKLGWDAQGIAQPPKGHARLCNRSAKTGAWHEILKSY